MNKTLLSAALIAGFGIAAFAPQTARADGTITFTGKVVNNTCTFDVNSSGGPNGTVTLPVVFRGALAAAGATAGDTNFNIVVAGCDTNLTSVQERFSGSNVVADGNLQNTGSATGVEIQLLSGGAPINLQTNAGAPVGTLSSGGVTLSYTARYFATAAAGSGLVNTTVTYTTSYL
jgi:major type 1 subunit fimbrin (pilin)